MVNLQAFAYAAAQLRVRFFILIRVCGIVYTNRCQHFDNNIFAFTLKFSSATFYLQSTNRWQQNVCLWNIIYL